MRKYETYKPSGIDWIGDIPKHWNRKRLKDFAEIIMGQSPDSNSYNDEEIGVPFYQGKVDFGEFNPIPRIWCNQPTKISEAEDILISVRAPVGELNIANEKCCIGRGLTAVRIKKGIKKFAYYQFQIINEELKINVTGSTFEAVSSNDVSILKYIFPPLDEQLTIANYLDHQTQKIDRLIDNKKAQAEKLKELRQIEINNAVTKGLNPNTELKDSGIEWLGAIPKHWEVKRLKNIADINSTKQEVKYDDVKDLEIVFLPMENVSENGAIDNSDKRKASEIWEGFTYFKKNDVIIAKITPCFENGKGAWLNSLESEFGFGSTEFHTVRGHKNKLDNHYFYHVTKSDVFMKIGEAFMTGSAGQKRVSTNFVLTFKLAFPPFIEQLQIAQYIQERTIAIDRLIKNIETQIEKLQELRKIKIYEAVTGKIKVNAYVEATA
jgi:type I restriction enzyme S subunit